MKKLFLILVATVACTAFVNSASAQANVVVPLSNEVFSFDQDYPSVMGNGGEVVLNIKQFANASDPYPGKTARDMVDVALRQAGYFVRLVDFVIYGRVDLYDYGYVKLEILPARSSYPANLNFVFQSKTIRNYY